MTSEPITDDSLSSTDYLERARAIAPIIEAHAADGEAEGAMPPATITAL